MNDYREVSSGQMMRPGWAQGLDESGWTGIEYPYGYQSGSGFGSSRTLQKLGWYESQASVKREVVGHVVVVGPVGVGKRRLLAQLRGWSDSEALRESVEDLGFWTVVDLPSEAQDGDWVTQNMAWEQVQSGHLLLFVASGLNELRFLARLRASGQPLVVVGMGSERDARLLAQRVGQEVICVDTARQETLNQLLSAMIAANPALLVPLGRELPRWRRWLAKRLVGETALMCGFAGLEPVPLMDVPVQIMAQTRLALRLLAMYGHHSPSPIRRETLVLVGSCLLVRLVCEQALKVLPIAGWLLAGMASGTGTWLLGWLLVLSLETGDWRLVIGDWRRRSGD